MKNIRLQGAILARFIKKNPPRLDIKDILSSTTKGHCSYFKKTELDSNLKILSSSQWSYFFDIVQAVLWYKLQHGTVSKKSDFPG
ncbi:hypothetical protein BTVI_02484 [Pitangus sulphuratus]|nr:hypothetical protein BTVI_02484 [Pitangus sulphuratus]